MTRSLDKSVIEIADIMKRSKNQKIIEKGDSTWENRDSQTLLHIAALSSNIKVLKILLDFSSKITKDKHGMTPLHYASIKGFSDGISLLIEKGADIDSREYLGECSPLHLAALFCNPESVSLLIKSGSSIDHKDKNGATAFHKACYGGQIICAKELVVNGSFINAEDNNWNTGFLIAINGGHFDLATFLITRGSTVNTSNQYLDSPFWSLARQFLLCKAKSSYIELFQTLLKQGI